MLKNGTHYLQIKPTTEVAPCQVFTALNGSQDASTAFSICLLEKNCYTT